MRISSRLAVVAALLQVACVGGAWADEWKITRLSGSALVFYQGRWTPLRLGDVVTDTSAIRTLADGSLQFERDRETIDVQPNTEIRIEDRTGRRFTTVHEYFGAVGVEANRENVQHFEVKTPYLAAVVKGTMFAVQTTAKVSAVAVSRGKVGVSSALGPAHGDVSAGQTATVSVAKGFSIGHAGTTGAAAAAAATAAPSVAAAVASVATATATATATAAASSSSAASASTAASSASAAASSSSSAAASSASAAASSGASASGASAAAPTAATSTTASTGKTAASTSSNSASSGQSQSSQSQGQTGQGQTGQGQTGQGQTGQGQTGQGQTGQGQNGFGWGHIGFGWGHNGFGFGLGNQGAANGHAAANGHHGAAGVR